MLHKFEQRLKAVLAQANNQRTIGSLNAHLISGPSICTKHTKVKRMQRSGTEAIRIQIQPSKSKRGITYTTNSQNTKRTYDQPSEQLVKMAEQV